jgi:hypothetical protein
MESNNKKMGWYIFAGFLFMGIGLGFIATAVYNSEKSK